jgi:hypothetical protein
MRLDCQCLLVFYIDIRHQSRLLGRWSTKGYRRRKHFNEICLHSGIGP